MPGPLAPGGFALPKLESSIFNLFHEICNILSLGRTNNPIKFWYPPADICIFIWPIPPNNANGFANPEQKIWVVKLPRASA